ncbi:MAG: hypothetical protein IJE59_01575 [Clostridia bacterium]|nr:hypothetical protein [Clostridia bacterium]
MTADTKKYSFEEVFKSPFEKNTEKEALDVLQEIRECHPASAGWVELNAYAEKLPNGKWRAVRQHAKL